MGANLFIVSSGSTRYATVTLPDDEVVAQFETRGELFRTDAEEGDCVVSDDKIGPDSDDKAGRCDNVVVTLSIEGGIEATYRREAD